MSDNLYNQIAFALAKEIGFYCFYVAKGEYSFQKSGIGCGPTLCGKAAGRNPCMEVPLDHYQLCINIEGSKLSINNVIHFDLTDPTSIEKFKAEFTNTARLAQKIDNLRYPHLAKSGEPGFSSL